jgi:hypothetical protein
MSPTQANEMAELGNKLGVARCKHVSGGVEDEGASDWPTE